MKYILNKKFEFFYMIEIITVLAIQNIFKKLFLLPFKSYIRLQVKQHITSLLYMLGIRPVVIEVLVPHTWEIIAVSTPVKNTLTPE